MRIVTFFISLFLLLLGGKDYSYEVNQNSHIGYSSTETLTKKLNVGFINEDFGVTVIDDTDSDLDEDHLSNEDVKEGSQNKLCFDKTNLQIVWFLSKFHLSILNYYNNRFRIFSHFCGFSNPIYILQRVLRI
ncbi:hypothetical protein [Flavobacterium sp.]|uniref:hypothetical protein n=1 Tax=Flavobacterium sp. TaxID=239 RepID=UPI0038FC15DB